MLSKPMCLWFYFETPCRGEKLNQTSCLNNRERLYFARWRQAALMKQCIGGLSGLIIKSSDLPRSGESRHLLRMGGGKERRRGGSVVIEPNGLRETRLCPAADACAIRAVCERETMSPFYAADCLHPIQKILGARRDPKAVFLEPLCSLIFGSKRLVKD